MIGNRFEIKVTSLLIITLAAVLATGYLSFTALSGMVNKIYFGSRPDLRLLQIKEIAADLSDAENSISLFRVTGEHNYLKSYYEVVENVDDKIEHLQSLNKRYPAKSLQIDSIHYLINKKLTLWEEMLRLQDDNRIDSVLVKISAKVRDIPQDTTPADSPGFFKRLFGKQETEKDSNSFHPDSLKKEIAELGTREHIVQQQIKSREFNIIQQNNIVSAKLKNMIASLEENESKSIRLSAREAEQLANETYKWIIIFCLSAILLLLIVVFIIFNYVRKSRQYQQALKEAKIQAENLATAKETFIANVSHELRTPVNAIHGLATQLTDLPAPANRPVQIIKRSADHLIHIINDVLDFAKLDSGKIKIDNIHFYPAEIMDDVYQLYNYEAENKRLDFSFTIDREVPEVLIGDPFRLKQILINLTGNAIKFTHRGKVSISLQIQNNTKKDVRLKVSVKDTGIGIDNENIETIFEDFTQAGAHIARDYGGTGLGLAIVKKLVEIQQGDITIESKKNKGTCITFMIPYDIGRETKVLKQEKEILAVPQRVKNLHVLIVDDAEFNRLVLANILKKWQVQFKEVSNGIEAVAEANRNHYDIILMDIRMPEMNGMEATRLILDNHDSSLKIIAMSAATNSKEIQACREAGMYAFITKPFIESKLLNTIIDLTDNKNPDTIQADDNDPEIKNDDPESSVDFEELNRVAGGDIDFVCEMLEVFIETAKKSINTIKQAMKTENYSQIADEAHKMAPPCRHLNADNLHQLLNRLEKNAGDRNNNTEMLSELVKQTENELEKVIRRINIELTRLKPL